MFCFVLCFRIVSIHNVFILARRGGVKAAPGLTFTQPRSSIRTHASQLPVRRNSLFAGLPLLRSMTWCTHVYTLPSYLPSLFSLRIVNRRSRSRVFTTQAVIGPIKFPARAASCNPQLYLPSLRTLTVHLFRVYVHTLCTPPTPTDPRVSTLEKMGTQPTGVSHSQS